MSNLLAIFSIILFQIDLLLLLWFQIRWCRMLWFQRDVISHFSPFVPAF